MQYLVGNCQALKWYNCIDISKSFSEDEIVKEYIYLAANIDYSLLKETCSKRQRKSRKALILEEFQAECHMSHRLKFETC